MSILAEICLKKTAHVAAKRKEVPQALLGQLKVGGRLVAIVGDEPMMRALRVVRLSEQEFRTDVLFDTVAPRLEGFAPASRFHF